MQAEKIIRELNKLKTGAPCSDVHSRDMAIEEAKAAVEKQKPKKFELLNGQDVCPTCRYDFGSDNVRRSLWSWKMDFCVNCGQALDWSDTK